MSGLNNIQLPESVLANIYKDTLIISDERVPKQAITEPKEISAAPTATPATTPQPLPAKWFLGNNNKGFVIIVKDADNVYLDENKLQLLSSILLACKMNLADVAIINYLQTPVTLQDIKAKITTQYLLTFGITNTELQVSLSDTLYLQQTLDNSSVIFAPDLGMMTGASNEAKLEKSKLWMSLKTMFKI